MRGPQFPNQLIQHPGMLQAPFPNPEGTADHAPPKYKRFYFVFGVGRPKQSACHSHAKASRNSFSVAIAIQLTHQESFGYQVHSAFDMGKPQDEMHHHFLEVTRHKSLLPGLPMAAIKVRPALSCSNNF